MTPEVRHLLREGVQYHQAGNLEAARRAYEAVLGVLPDQTDALHLLGVVCDQLGDHIRAVDLITRAITLVPQHADFHGNLGTALLALQRKDEAEVAYRKAVSMDPDYAEGHYNLANLLRQRGVTGQAKQHFDRTLSLQPQHRQALNNLAMLLWEDDGNETAAAAQFDRLLRLAPDWPDAHMNYGLFRLASGDYRTGWAEYEWRWKSDTYPERDWSLGLPRWDGEPIERGSLLLWGEQGVGDQILYGTMIADAVRQSGTKVCVAVDRRLVDLFSRSLACDDVQIIERGKPVDAIAQCPFGSLGLWLRGREDDFAGKGTYLRADPARCEALRSEYLRQAQTGSRLMGLSWRSGNRSIGSEKSIPLADLLPALRLPGILWVNLQYGNCSEDLAFLRRQGVAIIDDDSIDRFTDIDGLAAQAGALDAVVTVSNTTAHVAGALGVSCHLMLAQGRGKLWYWPSAGRRARRYDCIRIIRQETPGVWRRAVSELREELGKYA